MKSLIRLSILSALVTPMLITMSCSHLSFQDEKLSSQQESLLLAFQKAKANETADPISSCTMYTRLANESFPLKSLALLKSHLICTDASALKPVPADLPKQEPWLAALDSERMLIEAKRSKDPRELAKAYFVRSQRSDRVQEKVQLLLQAQESLEKQKSQSQDDQSFAKDISSRLERMAPRLLKNPQPKDYYAVAMDLIFQRQFAKGRSYLSKIQKSPAFSLEEQYQARRAYRNSFKTEQKKEQHVVEAGKFAKWTEKTSSPGRVHEAYTTWARAQWTQGDAGRAKKTLLRAEKILRKKKYPLDEVYFIRARMSEEAKNFDEALEFLSKAERESKYPNSVLNKILFSRAWIARKQQQYADAANSFHKLKEQTQDVFDKNRYSFWLAKSLHQSGQTEAAQKEFQEVIKNDPLGYYGMVAYRETNTEIPALNIERKLASADERPKQIGFADFDLIRALNFVEENEILGRFLDFKSAELRQHSVQDQEAWLYILKFYARAGLYNPLFAQVGALSNELKTELLTRNPELLFPRKFLELIQASGEKFGVRPELILSIIRQESAFNPEARSPADALGLMQLLPSVAREHEKQTGLKLEHFEDLYKPEMNIPFGASLLAALGKKYRGQFLLTAAAYNANEKAIESWLKTRLQDDPLEFIEDIPYEETRAYVKLVLRNFIFYSRLAAPSKSLAFPNWCLEDLQSFKVSTR